MTRFTWLLLSLSACASADDDAATPDATPTPDAPVAPDAPGPDAPQPVRAALWVLEGGTNANFLVRMDPATYAMESRTNLGYAGALWELAGSGTSRAYAIDRDLDLLVAIDLEAGAIVGTAQLPADMQQNGRGFGTAPDGSLWGIFAGTLARIDPTTGALSQQVTQQFGLIAESLETCDDQMYMASRESGGPRGEKLYAVDRMTGSATLRGAIGTTAIDVDTLACANGMLYGLDTDPMIGKMLFRIDTATGARTVETVLAITGDVNGVHATPGGDIIE